MVIGVSFIVVSWFLGLLMWFRWLPNRPLYRGALELLFATGVGFLIPNIVYIDILTIFVGLVIWDVVRHRKRR